jgi:hypothetical protein
MGTAIANRGLELVYGGGNVGLMGAVADSVLAAGGRVIGAIPQALLDREIAHRDLSELHVVGSMHERKALMAELSDAFIALPGGFGTMDEFFEILTWWQLDIHRKPCALLNIDGFFDPLITLFDHFVTEGFVKAEQRNVILADSDVDRLLDMVINTPLAPPVNKWGHPNTLGGAPPVP